MVPCAQNQKLCSLRILSDIVWSKCFRLLGRYYLEMRSGSGVQSGRGLLGLILAKFCPNLTAGVWKISENIFSENDYQNKHTHKKLCMLGAFMNTKNTLHVRTIIFASERHWGLRYVSEHKGFYVLPKLLDIVQIWRRPPLCIRTSFQTIVRWCH